MRNVSTLTTLACERLKRGSLGDPTHPGLRIMARPSGAKVWIYRFRDPAGKMAQLLIGSFPALSLADARSEWRNHRATKDKHGDPRDEVRRRREAATAAAGMVTSQRPSFRPLCGTLVQCELSARTGHRRFRLNSATI